MPPTKFYIYSAPCKSSALTHPGGPSWNWDGRTSWMLNKVAHLSGSELWRLMSGQQALVDRRTPESSWKRQPEQQLISHAAPAEGKLTPHMHTKPESLWKCILSVLAAFLCSKTKKIYILYSLYFSLFRGLLRCSLCVCVYVVCVMWACCHYITPWHVVTECVNTWLLCFCLVGVCVNAGCVIVHVWVYEWGSNGMHAQCYNIAVYVCICRCVHAWLGVCMCVCMCSFYFDNFF